MAQIAQFSAASQERAAADAEMRSALRADEAKAFTAIENSATRKSRGTSEKVLYLRNKSALDASALCKNMDSFLENT